jgi:hypothetical protein
MKHIFYCVVNIEQKCHILVRVDMTACAGGGAGLALASKAWL